MTVLLITGTIKPLVKVKYCDPQVRGREYMTNLKRYICDTDFDTIIFAENSGYPLDTSELNWLASEHGKEFRMLDVSAGADSGNMSTGEARIMQQALARCPFLSDEDLIWKVSGRIFIRNANKVLRTSRRYKTGNMFLYAPKYDSLQTWFFRAKVGDLKKYFLTEETVERVRKGCIEYAWMDVWRKYHREIELCPFWVYPDAEGINSSGNPYTLSRLGIMLKNLLLRLGYFTVDINKQRKDRSGL